MVELTNSGPVREDERTPVLIGVGEASERLGTPDYRALSPADLAANAVRDALRDASAPDLARHIDVIAAIRQFEVSTPGASPPFGAADNFPRAVAQRVGANPARAILEVAGGQGPQHLVNEMANAIGEGEVGLALLIGSEAISTVRHLTGEGKKPDWCEAVAGSLEDRGYGLDGLVCETLFRHGGRNPIQLYALLENARRARMGTDRETYRTEMAELFAPFTRVAADNPHAMSREVYTAEQLAAVGVRNRITSDPYPRRMVARDQANQGAAVLLASVGVARRLGVPQERWIYLHGCADVRERSVLQRPDLSSSPAAVQAMQQGLKMAEIDIASVSMFDLYSCFPIAVFNICEGLGLAPDDPRGLTVTGGLPFFGGAGNNYSMHAIAEMARRLRRRAGAVGLVGANGGFLSKYSVGVYSSTPKRWQPVDSAVLQHLIDSVPAPRLARSGAGEGRILTYTIDYSAALPRVTIIGSNDREERFVAMSAGDDKLMHQRFTSQEPLGARVTFTMDGKGRRIVTGFEPTSISRKAGVAANGF
jgi:acetyl-CoA C-acetyltransferase